RSASQGNRENRSQRGCRSVRRGRTDTGGRGSTERPVPAFRLQQSSCPGRSRPPRRLPSLCIACSFLPFVWPVRALVVVVRLTLLRCGGQPPAQYGKGHSRN